MTTNKILKTVGKTIELVFVLFNMYMAICYCFGVINADTVSSLTMGWKATQLTIFVNSVFTVHYCLNVKVHKAIKARKSN